MELNQSQQTAMIQNHFKPYKNSGITGIGTYNKRVADITPSDESKNICDNTKLLVDLAKFAAILALVLFIISSTFKVIYAIFMRHMHTGVPITHTVVFWVVLITLLMILGFIVKGNYLLDRIRSFDKDYLNIKKGETKKMDALKIIIVGLILYLGFMVLLIFLGRLIFSGMTHIVSIDVANMILAGVLAIIIGIVIIDCIMAVIVKKKKSILDKLFLVCIIPLGLFLLCILIIMASPVHSLDFILDWLTNHLVFTSVPLIN
ncbi:hypothetical protein NEOKW01_0769 [Nematocida sp. AWRm80]|nr:hypothetical protein NEOKW01_0769 [Nematocida sp. AWRm80]